MVETVVDPHPYDDLAMAGLASRTRTWLLTVPCFGVLLVISSMVALNHRAALHRHRHLGTQT